MPHRYRRGGLLHAILGKHPRGHRRPPGGLPRSEPHGARPQRIHRPHPQVLPAGEGSRQQEDVPDDAGLLRRRPRGRRGGEKRRHADVGRADAEFRHDADGALA